jgi:hypothetical protein
MFLLSSTSQNLEQFDTLSVDDARQRAWSKDILRRVNECKADGLEPTRIVLGYELSRLMSEHGDSPPLVHTPNGPMIFGMNVVVDEHDGHTMKLEG